MEKIKIDSKFADKDGQIMIIELGGHVDQSNSYQLQKMFDDVIDSNVFKIVVDFQDLHYMSSAGWGIFVGEVKRFRENGGDIKLAAMNPEINDVFQMLEFYHILDDFTTVKEASESFFDDDEILDVSGEEESKHSLSNMSKIDSESAEIEIEDSQNGQIEPKEKDKNDNSEKKEHAEVIELVPLSTQTKFTSGISNEFNVSPIKNEMRLTDLPLAEKVKRIISEHPLINSWQIKRILRHEHFGYTKINILKLWKILKDLDLNTKEKRYRYYRSC